MSQHLEHSPEVTRWVRRTGCERHKGGPAKGHTGMDEVIEKKALDKFFVNAVFGREGWSCKKIQWDTDTGCCASVERTVLETGPRLQAGAAGKSVGLKWPGGLFRKERQDKIIRSILAFCTDLPAGHKGSLF